MTTDLERLHKVRTKQLTGRGVGNTYAACYSACEWIRDNPKGTVFWFLPMMSWVDHIFNILDKLIEEFGFQDVKRYRTRLIMGQAQIKFIPVSTGNPYETDHDIRDATRGYKNFHNIYESLFEYAHY